MRLRCFRAITIPVASPQAPGCPDARLSQPLAKHNLTDACDLVGRAGINAADDKTDGFGLSGVRREIDPFVRLVRFRPREGELIGKESLASVPVVDNYLNRFDASGAEPILFLGAATGDDANLVDVVGLGDLKREGISNSGSMRGVPCCVGKAGSDMRCRELRRSCFAVGDEMGMEVEVFPTFRGVEAQILRVGVGVLLVNSNG